MEGRVLAWLLQYGVPLIFLVQFLGVFGLPIPDELLLTIAGALVRQGRLAGPPTAAAAVGGCAAGITLSFVLGRAVGSRVLAYAARRHPGAVERSQDWFRRFGRWLLAFGYFVPGVRHVTAIAAGSTRLRYQTFAAYAYPGAAVWSMTFVSLGYFAADRWRAALALLQQHGPTAAVAAFALVAAYQWLARQRNSA